MFRFESLCAYIDCVNVHQIPIALDMAKDSNGKDKELTKRILADEYMHCAVRECYASFRNIIKFLVQGNREKEYVSLNCIF